MKAVGTATSSSPVEASPVEAFHGGFHPLTVATSALPG